MITLLGESNLDTIHVVATFDTHKESITALSFSPSGEFLVSCGEDDRIACYDCIDHDVPRLLDCPTIGATNIQFANTDQKVIHSTVRGDNNIRHLNLETKTVSGDFIGHTRRVVSLSMAPVGEAFVSSSFDRTVRFWDLRTVKEVAIKELPYGHAIVAYDNTANIVAAAVNSENIHLFDTRYIDKGPFMTLYLNKEKQCHWYKLEFSHDNNTILISTDGPIIRCVDAIHSGTVRTFAGRLNGDGDGEGVPMQACYSPESKLIFTGSCTGLLHAWNFESGVRVEEFNGDHFQEVRAIAFNPKYNMFASGCRNTVLWQWI